MNKASAAARLLIEARQTRRQLGQLPADCRPADIAAAYAIQERHVAGLCEALDAKPVGYKVGCTNAGAQKLLGLSGPFSGVLLDRFVRQSPARIPSGDCFMRCIEAEFAFRMARDLPPSGAPYDAAAVRAAIAALMPAIEVVDTRYESWTTVGALALIADLGSTGYWVAGPERTDWQGFDLPQHAVRLWVNDKPVRDGLGANVLGDPLAALTWLANDLAARGRGLRAGEVVTTGTCIDVFFANAGDDVRADFGALGEAKVAFPA